MDSCFFIIDRSRMQEERSCQLSLTGYDIIHWSGGQRSSVIITCFYSGQSHGFESSPHSDPVTVTVQRPLRHRLRFLCPHWRHPGSRGRGGNLHPVSYLLAEGTLTGRPQGGQLRARTFTATALIGRYGTTPASSPKPGPYQGLAPTYSQSFPFSPGVLTADRTLHWTVLGEPTSHPGEV
ncbi:hypothetical protein E1301_Tti021537 [Triplophysa tibetana]|uniref:Uncharacterized protein n=1 Tax=Triplophysa tibetana TaxID=1572043 RepID=A0A5A9NF50_9TELE|nr:hypothetical protein E1301_Tti021537 [Triplophysa tibetana]